ncbi:CinA family protein [Desulfobotulus mexicanus]|uniref:CinA family protein n=1 Tax=Desulfobotulus mexicanus TaxID=2586642 RepID=UPI0015D2CCF6|nr:CinA family protein [Desulfobotulus mexicanus]
MNLLPRDADRLAREISHLLIRDKKTLAFGESCTGGLMAFLFTSLAGSSAYFKLSAVTYANEAKVKLLGVRPKTLEKHGAVSEAVAGEMALGARLAGMADYGLSTTGIAGPSGGSDEKPVGMVCVGLSSASGTDTWVFKEDTGDRNANQHLFAAFALYRLHCLILEESP